MIEAIYTAPKNRAPLQSLSYANLIAFQGIQGDRFCRKSRHTERNITLMAAEQVDWFNQQFSTSVDWARARRNVITRGVDVNGLIDREFRIGNVWFKGVELCEPCCLMGSWYQSTQISANAVIDAMAGRSGIRAEILNDGIIEVGMKIHDQTVE